MFDLFLLRQLGLPLPEYPCKGEARSQKESCSARSAEGDLLQRGIRVSSSNPSSPTIRGCRTLFKQGRTNKGSSIACRPDKLTISSRDSTGLCSWPEETSGAMAGTGVVSTFPGVGAVEFTAAGSNPSMGEGEGVFSIARLTTSRPSMRTVPLTPALVAAPIRPATSAMIRICLASCSEWQSINMVACMASSLLDELRRRPSKVTRSHTIPSSLEIS